MRALVWLIVGATLLVFLLAGISVGEDADDDDFNVFAGSYWTCKLLWEDSLMLREDTVPGHLKVTEVLHLWGCYTDHYFRFILRERLTEELEGKDSPFMGRGWQNVNDTILHRDRNEIGQLINPPWNKNTPPSPPSPPSSPGDGP